MTKEELKKEAIKYAVDYPTSYGKGYKHKDLRIAYLAGAEPREKRIEELENKIADIKANCDFALEGKDVEIKELKEVLKGLLEEEEKGLWFKADGSDKSRYYKLREKAEKILER